MTQDQHPALRPPCRCGIRRTSCPFGWTDFSSSIFGPAWHRL